MSKSSKSPSKSSSKGSVCVEPGVEKCCVPEFIYGGPFIKQMKIEPFIDTATPINIQLQGTFKKSFAYYSLKDRLPVILTKVIDTLSKKGDSEARQVISHISKLKNDLITNKKYDPFTEESEDARKWNEWIQQQEQPHYFTNIWVFSECYVYRKLKEGFMLTKSMKNYDPFSDQKDKSFANSLEPMCIVAEKMSEMLPESDKDKRKTDFCTLLKICLWANKCDLSLTLGEQVTLSGKLEDNKDGPLLDPFQMIIDLKDKILVDDTAKAADQVVAKAEAIAKSIEGPPPSPVGKGGSSSSKTSVKSPPAPPAGEGEEGEEAPKIPCPAKMTIPQSVIFDIICDNAGYELFTDLCFAHFLVSQKIVEKIRFHVKNMPWFVSDVTERDFKFVIDSCIKASYNRTVQPEEKPVPEGAEPPPPEEPRTVSSQHLQQLGQQWSQFVEDGTFIVMAEDYWTWPHVYKDMKKYDYNLYRKLQYAAAILFKGDLNYRKLLGERNCNPSLGFEPALQGFIPAPIIAVRTVKADLICGLPKGKWDQLNKIDEKWMEKGDYGVIHFCPKAEPLKVSEKPCLDYCITCFGAGCPVHTDM